MNVTPVHAGFRKHEFDETRDPAKAIASPIPQHRLQRRKCNLATQMQLALDPSLGGKIGGPQSQRPERARCRGSNGAPYRLPHRKRPGLLQRPVARALAAIPWLQQRHAAAARRQVRHRLARPVYLPRTLVAGAWRIGHLTERRWPSRPCQRVQMTETSANPAYRHAGACRSCVGAGQHYGHH